MASSSCILGNSRLHGSSIPSSSSASSTLTTTKCGENILLPPLHRCVSSALRDDSHSAVRWGRKGGAGTPSSSSPSASGDGNGDAFSFLHSSSSSRRAVAVFATQQQQPKLKPKQKKTTKKIYDATVDLDVDDDDDDDDGEAAVEFADMEEWMAKKPSGFGLKEYDTSLEERLLAEMEAEKMAEAVGKKKPPREPAKKLGKGAGADEIPEGVEVYVGNLPRKRNVDRDLRAAFRSASGLLHIRPVIESKQKSTREPLCKGLAFLTFASEDDALDFVERYNGENVKFGKAERGLTCQLALPKSPFKKPGDGKQVMDAPRLGIIKETYSDDSAPAITPALASSSSLPAKELAGIQSGIRVEENLMDDTSDLDSDLQSDPDLYLDLDLDLDGTEEQEDDDQGDDLDDLSEEERDGVAQEIYMELEDEDDLELDRELEEEESDNEERDHFRLDMEAEAGLGFSPDGVQGIENLVQVEPEAPAPIKSVGKAENSVAIEPKRDIRDAESGGGLDLELADSSKSNAGAVDKDRRIQELESELKQLQLQLEVKNSGEFSEGKVKELAVQLQEQRIEDLEKRIRSRAKAALAKDPKIKVSKRVAAPKKAASSKAQGTSKRNPSQTKSKGLGAASRLKKKERKIYTDAISKYSSSAS